jgi:hypothetical protein
MAKNIPGNIPKKRTLRTKKEFQSQRVLEKAGFMQASLFRHSFCSHRLPIGD